MHILKLPKIDVKVWKKGNRFSEEFQPTGIQYAFLSKNNEMCHGWVKCRDFLNDAIRMFLKQKKECIYGFSYNPLEDPALDMDNIRLLVRKKYSGVPMRNIMSTSIKLINELESYGGMTYSKLYKAKNVPNGYIFIGPPDWMRSTFLVSLYTFLIRLSVFPYKEEYCNIQEYFEKIVNRFGYNKDVGYLKDILPYIYSIIELRKELEVPGFLLNESIDYFHYHSGICYLCSTSILKNKLKSNVEA